MSTKYLLHVLVSLNKFSVANKHHQQAVFAFGGMQGDDVAVYIGQRKMRRLPAKITHGWVDACHAYRFIIMKHHHTSLRGLDTRLRQSALAKTKKLDCRG
jgi:hypothetical protein